MANPVCISPLKFYDDISKQCHRKSFAYNHISPLITPIHHIPPFQFVLGKNPITLHSVYAVNAKTGAVLGPTNQKTKLESTGFSIQSLGGYYVAIYSDWMPANVFNHEGEYYLEFTFSEQIGGNSVQKKYASEVFCVTNSLSDCLLIEYWNSGNRNFYLKNGVVIFPDNFKFKLYLKSELGKPEYEFEEEATKRLGYTFIESQVSKKVYKFNTVVPEFICDAMRIIRLCSDKTIHCRGEEYEAITFEVETEWQTQGDLASVTCTFETDNIVTSLGGFVPTLRGGDFNADYNNDFNT